MSYHTIQSLVLSLIFSLLIAPAIGYFSNALMDEMLNQAKLNYAERDSYKQLFDALQEGIIVIQEDQITFMNALSNTLLTSITGMNNFWMKEHADGTTKDNMTDRFS